MSAGVPGLPAGEVDHRLRGSSWSIAGVFKHHPWRDGIHSDALRAELGSQVRVRVSTAPFVAV